MIGLAVVLALIAPPADYLADARGRIHLSTSRLAQVRGWRDDRRTCTSSFELHREGAAAVRWTLDWKRVRNVQVSTRRHFMTDVEEKAYHQQPGMILYGRNTMSATLPDGAKVEFDNVEFFLGDPSKTDYALRDLKAQYRECRSR
jgi:hypothetical protein